MVIEELFRNDIEVDGYTDFVFLNRFGRMFSQQDLDRALERIGDAYNDAEIHEVWLRQCD